MTAIPQFGRYAALLVPIFFLLPLILTAQDARFRVSHLSTRDGLSQNDVRCIMQDRYGFLWFGTRNGLDKYDGYGFRTYRYDPFDTTSLTDYAVSAIAEDSAGSIWVGTSFGGLNRLDRRTGRSVRFRHDPRDRHALAGDRIAAIVVDRDGSVWIGSNGGLNRYDVRAGRMERVDTGRSGWSGGSVSSLLIDRRGELWVCSFLIVDTTGGAPPGRYRIGLWRYDRARKTFVGRWIRTVSNYWFRFVAEDPKGGINMANVEPDRDSTSGFFSVDIGSDSGEVEWMPLPIDAGFRGTPLLPEGNGWYWFLLHPFDVADDPSRMSSSLYCEPVVPASNEGTARVTIPWATVRPVAVGHAQTAFRDRIGSVWFGMTEGITQVSRIGSGVTTWRHDPDDTATLSARRIRSVQSDGDGTIWVGTDLGLNRYDRASHRWRRYLATGASALSHNAINVLYRDADGQLLIGTNGGLRRYDRRRDRFVEPYPALRLRNGNTTSTWSIVRDRRKRLWVGTWGQGMVVLDSTGRGLHWFRHDATSRDSILGGGVWALLEDRRGTIWVGTNEGLCRWEEEAQRFRCYQPDPGNRRSLGGTRIWALHEDREGNLWASSFGGGLSRYDSATDDFTTVTSRDGLLDNSLFGLLEDGAGVFWISSTKGLIRWDRRANTFRLYDEGDGLQGNEFAFKAFHKADDGTMYFGGVDGLSAFTPSDLRDNPHPPPVRITGFHLFDSLAAPELFDGDTVRLDHTQNFFAFEFAALDYINSGKNRYAYRLEGVDRDWIETDSERRRASYTDVKPGRYRFRVRGSNNDGVWNEEGTSITVIIAPPWYQTWWFRIAATLFLIGAVVVSVRLRIRTIRRHESEKRQAAVRATLTSQEAERERIARDLHDGIGQTLAAASINLARHHEMLKRENRSPDLQMPLERSMQILDRASLEVRAISHGLGTSTLRELGLAAALEELLEHLESEGTTRFEFATYGLEERLPEPIETGLFRVAQELITNVLRHAGAEEATVQILEENREIRLTVEDDGAGFDLDAPRNGMGFGNIAARVAAMGGRVHYDSMPGHGTSVTVVVGAAGVGGRGS